MGNQPPQPHPEDISYNTGYRCLQSLFTEATNRNPYVAYRRAMTVTQNLLTPST